MVSVLIVNWNTRDLLRACLASLARFPGSEELQVVVVDNASSDGSAAMIQADFPDVELVASEKNLGYAAGNNAAFAVARGDLLLTLNPDTEVFEDTLDNAGRILRSMDGYGALGARQLHPVEGTQKSVRGFPTPMNVFCDLLRVSDEYRLKSFDYERAQDAPQPMGTFLLFKREALEAVGDPGAPFDEQFPIFFNEVDLLYRLQKQGWKCWYDPSVRVLHHGGMSTRQVKKSMIWESHRSLSRFFRKHRPSPFNIIWDAIIHLGALVRARGFDDGFRS